MSRKTFNRASGFTILELTLAMTFLAFVMAFSATIVVQLNKTYVKGITMKQINQAGRTLADDLSRSLEGSAQDQLTLNRMDDGYLCVGNIAYIWNPVYKVDPISGDYEFNKDQLDRYKLGGETISLARVTSDNVNGCTGANPTSIVADVNNVSILSGRARVVAASREIAPISTEGNQLVALQFIIGTYDSSEASSLEAGGPALDTGVFNSAYINPSTQRPTCRPGQEGNFCSFGTYETTVYVSR